MEDIGYKFTNFNLIYLLGEIRFNTVLKMSVIVVLYIYCIKVLRLSNHIDTSESNQNECAFW